MLEFIIGGKKNPNNTWAVESENPDFEFQLYHLTWWVSLGQLFSFSEPPHLIS